MNTLKWHKQRTLPLDLLLNNVPINFVTSLDLWTRRLVSRPKVSSLGNFKDFNSQDFPGLAVEFLGVELQRSSKWPRLDTPGLEGEANRRNPLALRYSFP